MSAVVRFSDVSKCYQLGLSRTSVASLARQWARAAWRGRTATAAATDTSFWALKDVSFELQQGQSLALLGPNGAGKSTILKLLARITEPSSGRLQVNGRLAALIELGAGFHPDLTGRENIYLNGTLLGLRRREIEARFDEIVAFSELDQFIDTPIKRYSSGMTVRLGFAVASCVEPEILLVDEVLAVGDAAFRLKCVNRIKGLLDAGTSLIFVSHDMGLVKAVCRTALHLEAGAIQHAGPVAEVIDAYNAALDRRRAAALTQAGQSDRSAGVLDIARVEVLDEAGRSGTRLHGDQAVEVRVHYVAYRSITRANVVVRILRADGLSCVVARTRVDGCPVDVAAGQGTVSVRFTPLQLFAGAYHAVAWVTDADDTNGMSRGTSDWFEVKNRTAGLDAGDAVFEPARRWAHQGGPGKGAAAGPSEAPGEPDARRHD